MKSKSILVVVMVVCVMTVANIASATIIRGINIDFVTIGNPGNPGDTRVEANPSGCGVVGYEYQIGKYEVTNAQWNAFVSAAGAPTGNPSNAYDQSTYSTGTQQPTNGVSWYETLQFCNYLTSGDKSKGVYQFSGNNTNPGDFLGIDRNAAISAFGTVYVIPTEDEWYKAAYYKPDGSGYSSYTNGQNTIPAPDNGWNYYGGAYSSPWDVGTGTLEQNGTYDMMGNVSEWNETLLFWEWKETLLCPIYGVRGGACNSSPYNRLGSSYRADSDPYNEGFNLGFRVASVPEPTTLLLLGLGGLMLRKKQ
ncbi:MAG: SUMF1/EgtB/PvdO family nonheme iron enzyme [Planctomycetota bacterium]